MPKGKSKAGGETIKTSITLDRDLWKRAHVRAMDEGIDLQDIVAKALALYLKGAGR
jgi:hypothetical protein